MRRLDPVRFLAVWWYATHTGNAEAAERADVWFELSMPTRARFEAAHAVAGRGDGLFFECGHESVRTQFADPDFAFEVDRELVRFYRANGVWRDGPLDETWRLALFGYDPVTALIESVNEVRAYRAGFHFYDVPHLPYMQTPGNTDWPGGGRLKPLLPVPPELETDQ